MRNERSTTMTAVSRAQALSRREFLARAPAGLGTFSLVITGCGSVPLVQGRLVDGTLHTRRADVDALLRTGEPVLVTGLQGDDPLILVRDDDGAFRALSSRCTHLGCQVRPSARSLRCPCHGSTFDLRGNVLRGPAQGALPTYPVELVGDTVEIILP